MKIFYIDGAYFHRPPPPSWWASPKEFAAWKKRWARTVLI